jgi:hypothetical protein
MRPFLLASAALIASVPAFAQTAAPGASQPSTSGAPAMTSTCKAQATGKKLAGAAMNSFMKKCESDATMACTTQAANQKLAGAAKASFTKKCVGDAVGT